MQLAVRKRLDFCQEVLASCRAGQATLLGPTGILKRRQLRLKKLEEWHMRERRAKEREANQRVLALKSHNYEEYLRLAASAKDLRLKKLMDTTDDIMRKLRQKVGIHRISEGSEDQVQKLGAHDPSEVLLHHTIAVRRFVWYLSETGC